MGEIELSIDTGFSGALSLPPHLVVTLDLPFDRKISLRLADGTVLYCDRYVAMVEWHGREEPILVYEVETNPLLGMAMLLGSELKAQVVVGGTVEVTELPPVP